MICPKCGKGEWFVKVIKNWDEVQYKCEICGQYNTANDLKYKKVKKSKKHTQ